MSAIFWDTCALSFFPRHFFYCFLSGPNSHKCWQCGGKWVIARQIASYCFGLVPFQNQSKSAEGREAGRFAGSCSETAVVCSWRTFVAFTVPQISLSHSANLLPYFSHGSVCSVCSKDKDPAAGYPSPAPSAVRVGCCKGHCLGACMVLLPWAPCRSSSSGEVAGRGQGDLILSAASSCWAGLSLAATAARGLQGSRQEKALRSMLYTVGSLSVGSVRSFGGTWWAEKQRWRWNRAWCLRRERKAQVTLERLLRASLLLLQAACVKCPICTAWVWLSSAAWEDGWEMAHGWIQEWEATEIALWNASVVPEEEEMRAGMWLWWRGTAIWSQLCEWGWRRWPDSRRVGYWGGGSSSRKKVAAIEAGRLQLCW